MGAAAIWAPSMPPLDTVADNVGADAPGWRNQLAEPPTSTTWPSTCSSPVRRTGCPAAVAHGLGLAQLRGLRQPERRHHVVAGQVITISNTGAANATGMSYPAAPAHFGRTTTCTGTLAAGGVVHRHLHVQRRRRRVRSAPLTRSRAAAAPTCQISLSGTGVSGDAQPCGLARQRGLRVGGRRPDVVDAVDHGQQFRRRRRQWHRLLQSEQRRVPGHREHVRRDACGRGVLRLQPRLQPGGRRRGQRHAVHQLHRRLDLGCDERLRCCGSGRHAQCDARLARVRQRYRGQYQRRADGDDQQHRRCRSERHRNNQQQRGRVPGERQHVRRHAGRGRVVHPERELQALGCGRRQFQSHGQLFRWNAGFRQPLGTGTAPASANVIATPTTLAFGTITVGTTSATQAVTLSNTGTAQATGIGFANSNAAEFVVSGNTCGATLQCGRQLHAQRRLRAERRRVRTARRCRSARRGAVPRSRCPAPAPRPRARACRRRRRCSRSATWPSGRRARLTAITISNTGSGAADRPCDVEQQRAEFLVSGNTCAGALNAGATCTLNVAYAPSAAGSDSATLTFNYAGGGSCRSRFPAPAPRSRRRRGRPALDARGGRRCPTRRSARRARRSRSRSATSARSR